MYKVVLRTQPDGKLVTLAAAGSEPAFEVIVHRYRRPLLGYCRGRLRLSDSRSEDVVQQAFINAWGSLRNGTEVRELRPWLYRITHNQAVTVMRAADTDELYLRELGNETGPAGAEYSESTRPVDRIYEDQARLQETLSAVAALPELQRRALLATAVDGLSYDQIADQLDTSSDAVRGLVHRARNTLRTGIAAVFPGPLVVWAANQVGPNVSADSVQQWVSEATIGGGSVGMGAALTKGAVVLASSAAVVTGGVGAKLATHALAPVGDPSQLTSAGGHAPAYSTSAADATKHPAIRVASHMPSTHAAGGPGPDRLPRSGGQSNGTTHSIGWIKPNAASSTRAPSNPGEPTGTAHGFVPMRQGSRLTEGRAPSEVGRSTTAPRPNPPEAPAPNMPGGA